MHPVLDDLITLLQLERIEDNIFRGESRDIGSAQVFGGQVLGQALSAAQHTVDGRVAHSLHAYFLRRGDMQAPIVYEVDRARDGGSFSNRRVVAIQHGRPILNLAASFQNPEQGVQHQARMPDVPGPDDCRDIFETEWDQLQKMPEVMRRHMADKRAFEIRPAPQDGRDHMPRKNVWLRTVDKLPAGLALHQNLLAYASDYELLGVSTLPHDLPFGTGSVIMASLDHALWFHRPMQIDEWLLYSMDSPNASGARGYARGQFFSRDGELIASTAQEGLVRVVTGVAGKRSDPKLQD
ncbi:MAG: acyl-CoA thioesterase II [Gammaproteobacteria bacterium]|nr:acyl-CoA thioesterase II [Gammaproteobacteria bacterium]MDH5304111.1 acyl-CoA thioesterase II [Gammaproteobacteria bacterium]MDH5322544.1 acyl-CoA thioesterase II [Gammaproteobacteria bacterium]